MKHATLIYCTHYKQNVEKVVQFLLFVQSKQINLCTFTPCYYRNLTSHAILFFHLPHCAGFLFSFWIWSIAMTYSIFLSDYFCPGILSSAICYQLSFTLQHNLMFNPWVENSKTCCKHCNGLVLMLYCVAFINCKNIHCSIANRVLKYHISIQIMLQWLHIKPKFNIWRLHWKSSKTTFSNLLLLPHLHDK